MAKEKTIMVEIGTPLDEVEKRVLLATLAAHHGNKPITADVLGIALKTLYRKLNQYQGRAA